MFCDIFSGGVGKLAGGIYVFFIGDAVKEASASFKEESGVLFNVSIGEKYNGVTDGGSSIRLFVAIMAWVILSPVKKGQVYLQAKEVAAATETKRATAGKNLFLNPKTKPDEKIFKKITSFSEYILIYFYFYAIILRMKIYVRLTRPR